MNDKKLIIFRIIFNQKVGSGHLYQNLALIDSIDQSMFDIHVDLITDEKKFKDLFQKYFVSFSSYLDTKFLDKLDINSYFETFLSMISWILIEIIFYCLKNLILK